jgi:hypothetical protein
MIKKIKENLIKKFYSCTNLQSALLIFIFGILNFSLRNLDAFYFPILYAEDGVWVGKILSNGFWHTAFNARPEFPVFGLVLLQKISLFINECINSGDLFKLPIVIGFVSAVFLSFPAALIPFINESIIGKKAKIYLIVSIFTISVGSDGGEIFGRILNLGFYYPLYQIVSFLLLISIRNKKSEVFFLIINFISILTFPVCFAISALIMVVGFYWKDTDKYYQRIFWISVLAILSTVYFLIRIKITTGGAGNVLVSQNLFEFIFARMGIYPLIFGVYKYLNDIIIFALFASFLVYLYLIKKENSKLYFPAVTIAIGSFALYFVITLFFRYGLTTFLQSYQSTYPDRYYYGLNLIFVFMLVITLNKILPEGFINILLFLLIFNFTIKSKYIFELNSPSQHWHSNGDLSQMFCFNEDGKDSNELSHIEIPIYPITQNNDWKILIPSRDYIIQKRAFCK